MSNKPVSDDSGHGAQVDRSGGLAAILYAGSAFIAALAFLMVTTFAGSYPAVARFGGAIWIFILMMIVLMPIVIPRVKKRSR